MTDSEQPAAPETLAHIRPEEIRQMADAVRHAVGRSVIGQQDAVDLTLTALLCNGHVLLEGVPGVAKTLLARSLAASLSLDFGRIQFTPDLMPGDVIGTNLFDFRTNSFSLTKGPIFTELLLADEINRTPPKTQAALLQAMQERCVTIDGTTHDLGDGFIVVATQNPIEQQGTYPLPEAQLDRFLFKIELGYPERGEEEQIIALHGASARPMDVAAFGIEPVAGLETLRQMRQAIAGYRLAPEITGYIVDLVRATREDPSIQYGASPRAGAMLAMAVRARAALSGRDFAIPDDVKQLAPPALRHRIVTAPAAELEGIGPNEALARLIERVPAPR